jgi:Fe2+ transport system protein B
MSLQTYQSQTRKASMTSRDLSLEGNGNDRLDNNQNVTFNHLVTTFDNDQLDINEPDNNQNLTLNLTFDNYSSEDEMVTADKVMDEMKEQREAYIAQIKELVAQIKELVAQKKEQQEAHVADMKATNQFWGRLLGFLVFLFLGFLVFLFLTFPHFH